MKINLIELPIQKKQTTYDYFFEIIQKNNLTHEQLVKFALFSAKLVIDFIPNQYKYLNDNCINLIEKWLENHDSVTKEQLISAANAFYYCASYSAANASAYAAARCTAYASNAVVNATYASNAVVNAIYYGIDAKHEIKSIILRYLQILLTNKQLYEN